MRKECLQYHITKKMHGMFRDLDRIVWVDYSPHTCMCIYKNGHMCEGMSGLSVHTHICQFICVFVCVLK